ncbi:unnamed protein product, partial [Polarella glacialis]
PQEMESVAGDNARGQPADDECSKGHCEPGTSAADSPGRPARQQNEYCRKFLGSGYWSLTS